MNSSNLLSPTQGPLENYTDCCQQSMHHYQFVTLNDLCFMWQKLPLKRKTSKPMDSLTHGSRKTLPSLQAELTLGAQSHQQPVVVTLGLFPFVLCLLFDKYFIYKGKIGSSHSILTNCNSRKNKMKCRLSNSYMKHGRPVAITGVTARRACLWKQISVEASLPDWVQGSSVSLQKYFAFLKEKVTNVFLKILFLKAVYSE